MELSQVPATAETTGTYVYELSWAGFDPDGRIARFLYTVDPPSRVDAETVWVSTTDNRRTFVFHADSIGSGTSTRARGFHTVAVLAMDNRGARSPVVSASFTATTVTPSVVIESPVPSSLLEREVAPAVRISWRGLDPDGPSSLSPVSYYWKLLTESGEFPRLVALVDPDSLRRFYAPEFAGWESLPGTSNSVELRNLIPGQHYTFVVVAIDEAGAYSPVFSTTSNMLNFSIKVAGTLGPILTIGSPVFEYTFPSGGFFLDPGSFVRAELPADWPVQFWWSASTTSGSFIRGYRWAVDIRSIDDETPRVDEDTDRAHWSRWTTSASIVLPPVSPPEGQNSETHLFYLEAEDDLGLRSLGVVQYTAVRASFDRPLLVVDDTWLTPDRAMVGGCVTPPSGTWPSAAELDTFLCAVGDKPYRCYPAGTRSTPGVLAGYDFDTLTTHLVPPTRLTLSLLDRYRHIIWMSDLNSAVQYDSDPFTQGRPMPLLRAWSAPGARNPLMTWILQGGRLWLMGGGAAYASLRSYDAHNSPNNVFSASLGEIPAGQLMHSFAHWRSEVTILPSARAVRSPRADGASPGAPDYTELPAELLPKSPATDPIPPLRTGLVYSSSYPAEFLSRANSIAGLDTLLETAGGLAGNGFPVMTYYHGPESSPFVFSGFPLWYFQRQHAIGLADFVLQRVWGLTRRSVPR